MTHRHVGTNYPCQSTPNLLESIPYIRVTQILHCVLCVYSCVIMNTVIWKCEDHQEHAGW